jgi:hypothetical protein
MVDKRNAILNAHPDITPHVEAYHSLFPPALKYLEQDGVIDAAKRATLEAANPTFSPLHRQFETTWYDRLWGPPKGKSTDTSFLDLEKREDLTTEALQPGEIGNAIDLAEDYFHKLIAQTTINRARVTFGDSVQGLTRNGKPIVTYVTKAPTDPSTKAIRVFRNGHEEWMIPDTRGSLLSDAVSSTDRLHVHDDAEPAQGSALHWQRQPSHGSEDSPVRQCDGAIDDPQWDDHLPPGPGCGDWGSDPQGSGRDEERHRSALRRGEVRSHSTTADPSLGHGTRHVGQGQLTACI